MLLVSRVLGRVNLESTSPCRLMLSSNDNSNEGPVPLRLREFRGKHVRSGVRVYAWRKGHWGSVNKSSMLGDHVGTLLSREVA